MSQNIIEITYQRVKTQLMWFVEEDKKCYCSFSLIWPKVISSEIDYCQTVNKIINKLNSENR